MPSLVSIVPLQPVTVAGRTHACFELTAHQLDVADSQGTALWVVERVPLYFTITLVEWFIDDVVPPPSMSLSLWSDLPDEQAPWHEIATLLDPTPARVQAGLRVTAPCRRLVAKATVTTPQVQTVVRARITLVDDHF